MITIDDRNGNRLLDTILERMDQGDVPGAMHSLYTSLDVLKRRASPDDWRQLVDLAVDHPLRERIHRCPMTRRSFDKPRGYAGDAVLLDYIYGLRTPDPSDEAAQAVYSVASQRPAAKAVRERRTLIARLIDEVAARAGRPIRVLSIAAGHLRETELSQAFAAGQVEEFVALDSDRESCAHLSATFPEMEVRNESFTALFRDRHLAGHFDLVYSAGLFDYLEERIARRLTRQMCTLARAGGTVFLTNFLPTTIDAGYMESYMGWELIYRGLPDLARLTADVATEDIRETRVFGDRFDTIGYLQVELR